MFKIHTAIATVAVSAASSVFGAAYLDNVVNVQATGVITNNVTSGEATLSTERITVGENAIVKDGAGTMVIPNAKIDQAVPLRVTVREGNARIDMEGSAGTPCTQLPESIKAKMLWWGAIDDDGHLLNESGNPVSYLTDGAQVATWYDKRETDISNPQYHRMVVLRPSKGYPCFRVATNICGSSSLSTTNTWRGLYFKGHNSSNKGIGMNLVNKSGSAYYTYDQHMFVAVHGQTSARLGSLAGSNSDDLNIFSPCIDDLNVAYMSPTAWIGASAYCWLDGKSICGADTAVQKGLHLIEYASPTFMSQNELSKDSSAYSWSKNNPAIFLNTKSENNAGGDDVLEYMIFTQSLSEKERLEVENYLMHKWGIPTANPSKRVTIAPTAKVMVDAASGATVSNLEMSIFGDGLLTKTGAGTYVHDLSVVDSDQRVNPAAIDIQGGSVLMRRLASPILVGGGKTVNAAIDYSLRATKVTVSDAAGTLVKTGDGRVRVMSAGEDVKTIDVQAGTLAIGGETEVAPSSDYWTDEIMIPNAGFENWADYGKGYTNLPGSAECYGWYKEGGDIKFNDFTKYCDQAAFKWDAIRAPEGNSVLHLKQPYVILSTANTLHFEKPGEYEFSCYMYGRVASAQGFMVPVQVKLLSSDKKNIVADFGTIRLTSTSGFQPKALRANVEAAGDYYLQIKQVHNSWRTTTDQYRDCSTLLDDLHIRRLGPVDEKIYRIPNGDFEAAEVLVPFSRCIVTNITEKSGVVTTNITTVGSDFWQIFTNENNHCTGWAFNDPAGWSDSEGYPAVGLVNPYMRTMAGRGRGSAFYSRDNVAYNGAIELLFRGNGANVVTSFTPPAGTWRLSAMLANKHLSGTSGTLKATVKIGEGEPIELGELSTDYHRLYRQTWPNEFTVDGVTKVTLTVTHVSSKSSNCGLVADDFILTQRYYTYPEELLPQGTLMSMGGSQSQIPVNWTRIQGSLNTTMMLRFWGESQWAFGYGYYGGGDGSAEIWCDCGIWTTVKLPCAGRYRLTYLTRRRYQTSAAPNAIFSLVKSGSTITNVIDISQKVCPCGAMERRDAYFYVSEGGTYKLILQGDKTNSKDGYYQNVSDISIRPAFDDGSAGTPCTPIAADTLSMVKVAEGAKLRLDFNGTKNASHVRLGGKVVSGEISKATYPDYILGDGKINVVKPGFIMLLK